MSIINIIPAKHHKIGKHSAKHSDFFMYRGFEECNSMCLIETEKFLKEILDIPKAIGKQSIREFLTECNIKVVLDDEREMPFEFKEKPEAIQYKKEALSRPSQLSILSDYPELQHLSKDALTYMEKKRSEQKEFLESIIKAAEYRWSVKSNCMGYYTRDGEYGSPEIVLLMGTMVKACTFEGEVDEKMLSYLVSTILVKTVFYAELDVKPPFICLDPDPYKIIHTIAVYFINSLRDKKTEFVAFANDIHSLQNYAQFVQFYGYGYYSWNLNQSIDAISLNRLVAYLKSYAATRIVYDVYDGSFPKTNISSSYSYASTTTPDYDKNCHLKEWFKDSHNNVLKKGNLFNLDKETESICKWIVNDWGGISSFKVSSKLSEIKNFMDAALSPHCVTPSFNNISSLSKIASFTDPCNLFVYDSRAIYSLNWLILKYNIFDGKEYKFFPMPQGRNVILNNYDLNPIIRLMSKSFLSLYPAKDFKLKNKDWDLELFYDKKLAYKKYCQLIKYLYSQVYGTKGEPYKMEMLLYAIAEICAEDMYRSLNIV